MTKVYLDKCYFCHENKEAIKYSQKIGDPIFCGEVDYYGECQWERDRHMFVISEEAMRADEANEIEAARQMGEMADWMMKQDDYPRFSAKEDSEDKPAA